MGRTTGTLHACETPDAVFPGIITISDIEGGIRISDSQRPIQGIVGIGNGNVSRIALLDEVTGLVVAVSCRNYEGPLSTNL